MAKSTMDGRLKLFSASLGSVRGGTPSPVSCRPKLPLKAMLRKRTRNRKELTVCCWVPLVGELLRLPLLLLLLLSPSFPSCSLFPLGYSFSFRFLEVSLSV